MKRKYRRQFPAVLLLLVFLLLGAAGCSPTAPKTGENQAQASDRAPEAKDAILALPEIEAAKLDGRPLEVVATTSIIGDVVAQVGGDKIALTVLIGPGEDPHSYKPVAGDLTAAASADIIFVNGWDLEEGLINDLETVRGETPLIPVAAGITPLAFDGSAPEDGQNTHRVDPHTWFNVGNVKQWVKNIAGVLSDLDPQNAAVYEQNAADYLVALADLEAYASTQIAGIPEDRRFLVTNHDSLGYFAKEYGFKIIGTVIPGTSTLAEPSASDLTRLIANMEENGICTIFSETAVSDTLANTVASELSRCATVDVLPLYTGGVGPPGSGADSYITMFRANVDTIVAGTK